MSQTGYVRYVRRATCSNQNSFTRNFTTIYTDLMRTHDFTAPCNQFRASRCKQISVNAFQPIKFSIFGSNQRRPVMYCLINRPAKSCCIFQIAANACPIHQKLLGDTTSDNTSATRSVFFNHSDARTKTSGDPPGSNPARAGTNNDEIIIIFCCHFFCPLLNAKNCITLSVMQDCE